ncbi:cytidine deaminase [Hungatella hathewayi]|uniref:cytidine deaminase n=1 Tax=Hungatella hathewayi TaxID=154046 RepID=UPI00210B711F|nr:cytidine deaminase [Hungatella hathewayi]MCQ5384703.1 cytidine deaminase [Hungatella hathewayi]
MYHHEMILKHAFDVLKNSYAPYSEFHVAACIEVENGEYITGVNVENASYGLSNCAERSAIFSAYTQGYRKNDIKAIAVVTRAEKITTPCGACRQVLSELLCPDTPVILSNGKKELVTNMKELLPFSFGQEDLTEG